MNKFLVDVSTGGEWSPFLLWDAHTTFRVALSRLEKQCRAEGLNMDVYRLRRLTDSSEIIEAGRTIGSRTNGQ